MQTEHFLFFAQSIRKETAFLDTDDSHHALSVLRLSPGENIRLTDGNGFIYRGLIDSVLKGQVSVHITEKTTCPKTLPLIDLYVGIPDKNAFENLIDMVVPLGVSNITPVVGQFCQRKWWEHKWNKIYQRFEKKMIVGIKQSKSAFLPRLNQPVSFEKASQTIQPQNLQLVASPDGNPVVSVCKKIINAPVVTCWVGPPGGFSPEEEKILSANKASEIWLSPNRLRTELAATLLVANVIQCTKRERSDNS